MSDGQDIQAVDRVAATSGRSRAAYGSDIIVDLMKAYEIEYAALNPGATFRGLHDSIVNYGGNTMPQIILCNHEEIAVAVAQGYAKAKNRPMAAIVHNVVGLLHAAMAIYTAWLDRTPLLVMGGTGPMAVETRRPWIDWIHTALVQGNAIRDYVKWDDQPSSLQGIVESFIRGYRIATTEPQGPIYLCWDAALQEQRLDSPVAIPDINRYAPPSVAQADPSALARAARWLIESENPVILADYVGRTPEAVPSLVQLAESLAIPVIDLGSRLNFPNTHPLDLAGAEAELLPNADVVLALDVFDIEKAISTVDRTARIPRSQLKSGARLIHISFNDFMVRSWAQEYGRLQPIDLPIAADTSLAIPAITALCRSAVEADGDLLYTPSALWTAAHHRIPLLIVMHNNRSYFNDEEHQILMAKARNRPVENAHIGQRMDNPPVDFASMAKSFGIEAWGPIEEPGEIRPALERAMRYVLKERKPALVDVFTQFR